MEEVKILKVVTSMFNILTLEVEVNGIKYSGFLNKD